MYETYIFDFDGTIVDSEMIGLNALQATLKEVGIEKDLADLRIFLGIPGRRTLDLLDVPEKEKTYQKWLARERPLLRDVQMFAGIIDVIEQLPENSIVTSKTEDEMNHSYHLLGIEQYFTKVITASDTEKHKPHPEPLQLALRQLKRGAGEALYIGDSVHDMECAHAAGVDFGLALWGAKTTEGFEKAAYIFEKPDEILRLVDESQ
ncbi:HAD family hydrolase [Natribacillus halophilus]|nr:HAD family hydrolase [Natribacillus halophilus]